MSSQLHTFLASVGRLNLINNLIQHGIADVDSFRTNLQSEDSQTALGLSPLAALVVLYKLDKFLSSQSNQQSIRQPISLISVNQKSSAVLADHTLTVGVEHTATKSVHILIDEQAKGSNLRHPSSNDEKNVVHVLKRVRGKYNNSPTLSIPNIPNGGILIKPYLSNGDVIRELKDLMELSLCQAVGLTPRSNELEPLSSIYSPSLCNRLATCISNFFLKYFIIISKEEVNFLVGFLIFDKPAFHDPTKHWADKVTTLVNSKFYESLDRANEIDRICRTHHIEKKTVPHWASTAKVITDIYLLLKELGHPNDCEAISDATFLHFQHLTYGKLETMEKERSEFAYNWTIKSGIHTSVNNLDDIGSTVERTDTVLKAGQEVDCASQKIEPNLLQESSLSTPSLAAVPQIISIQQQLEIRNSRAALNRRTLVGASRVRNTLVTHDRNSSIGRRNMRMNSRVRRN